MSGCIDLTQLPKAFSFSAYLSPAVGRLKGSLLPATITYRGQQINSVYMILLALNEECRVTAKGAFYHLPLRGNDHVAHACDIVYLPDTWNNHDKQSWDRANWVERLQMCTIVDRIKANEEVLPICARILRFDRFTGTMQARTRRDSGYGDENRSLCDHRPQFPAMDSANTTGEPFFSKCPSSQYDPAVKSNSLSYSRPMEDISSYLILYTSHQSTPILCPTASFEHCSLSSRTLTPNDFSETFEYGVGVQHTDKLVQTHNEKNRKVHNEVAAAAAKSIMTSGMSSNRELVECLWTIWNEDSDVTSNLEKGWMGRIKYSWQEVKSILDGGRLGNRVVPFGWPTS